MKFIYSVCIYDSNYIESLDCDSLEDAYHEMCIYLGLHLPNNYHFTNYSNLKHDLLINGVTLSELIEIHEL